MPRTLLCVGDDSRLISFYDQLLQKHLSFRWASNPAEALEILRTEHTHKLLLMDMRVATEDQRSVSEQMRAPGSKRDEDLVGGTGGTGRRDSVA